MLIAKKSPPRHTILVFSCVYSSGYSCTAISVRPAGGRGAGGEAPHTAEGERRHAATVLD